MRTRALVILLVFALIVAIPAGIAVEPGFQNLILDLNGYGDGTLDAVQAHLPQPAAATGIGPGSHLIITMPGGTFGCTGAFIFKSGSKRYLGAAGHCFLPENKTATHGPGADYKASGTTVRVCVANCSFGGELGFFFTGTLVKLGSVAYARQTQGGEDIGNDFGIVEIPSSLNNYIRPSMPVWGGPTATGRVTAGSIVCHYGNGVGVGEVFATMGRAGVGVATFDADGWWLAELAAAFGDSGSGAQVCGTDSSGVHGRGAAGVLTHITNLGIVGTTMAKAAIMAKQAGINITLVPGT
jgi:hypothetical protein